MDIHGGNPRAVADRYGLPLRNVVDFSANINPLGPPDSVVRGLRDKLECSISRYPDPETATLRMKLHQFHNISPDNILLGNGSTSIIYLIPMVLASKKILVIEPAFSEYIQALKGLDCKVSSLVLSPEDNFSLNIKRFESELSKGYDLIFMGNPSNPTGTLLTRNDMIELSNVVFHCKTMLVVDEAFMDFCNGESLIDLATREKGLMILRSMTKFYSLPGLRIGYLVGYREMIDKIRRYQYPWSVNTLAQKAGVEALKDRSFIKDTYRWLEEERPFFYHGLQSIEGLYPYPSKTNYILTKILKKEMDAVELQKRLFQRGFLIRDCSSFRGLGNSFFRVAVLRREENTKLLKALKEVIR